MDSAEKTGRWAAGDVIVRREVWRNRPWMAMQAVVVEDDLSALVLYVPTGSPFAFEEGPWPTADGRHPWDGIRSSWAGHGALMLHFEGEPYAIWHFWSGQDRQFVGWYLNLQDPYRRTERGIDTLDHEIDIVVGPDGEFEVKDEDAFADCIEYGRFDHDVADRIRDTSAALTDRLRHEGIWWDKKWVTWSPPDDSSPPALPSDWSQ